MGRDNGEGPLNTLKPQPGQSNQFHPTNHPLPGQWAQEQLKRGMPPSHHESRGAGTGPSGDLKSALAAEAHQHKIAEIEQGVTPGLPEYEDPRAWQNTLLPSAKYGTEGRGYG